MNRIALAILSLVLVLQTAVAQKPEKPVAPTAPVAPITPTPLAVPKEHDSPVPRDVRPVRFDLNFDGGTPGDLIDAIKRARGKAVNAVIPEEFATIQLPPLKMNDVTVAALFEALRMASIKVVKHVTGTFRNPTTGDVSEQYSQKETGFGFRTNDREPTDNSVWFFFSNRDEQVLPDVLRFYHLENELEKYKIEDITTSIQTGWKLLGLEKAPTLKFHPETKLLIAVGKEIDLQVINSVLSELRGGKAGKPDAGAAKK